MLRLIVIGFIALATQVMCIRTAACQQLPDVRFKRHDTSDGLSFNGVTTIAQDSVGFLWIGTREGLNRFDGYTYIHYWHDPEDSTSLSGDEAHYVYVDRQGVVWVVGPTGLNRYERETDSFTRFQVIEEDPTKGLSHIRLCCILEGNDGFLWIGSNDGLNRFDRKTETFKHYKHDPGDPKSLSSGPVSEIYEDRAGTLWVGTLERYGGLGGLNRFDRATETFERYVHDSSDERSLIDNSIRSIYEDSYGTFWVGAMGDDALHTMDRETGIFTRLLYDPDHPERLSQPRLRSSTGTVQLPYYKGLWTIQEDSNGIIWFGAFQDGMDRYDPRTGAIQHHEWEINNPWSMGQNWTWNFYLDNTGAMWVADDASASLAQTMFFKHYRAPTEGEPIEVTAVLEDLNENIWVGTKAGIRLADPGTSSLMPIDALEIELSSRQIYALLESKDGYIWTGTDEGLIRWHPENKIVKWYRHAAGDPQSIHSGPINAIFEDESGSIWAGSENGTISILDPETQKFTLILEVGNTEGEKVTSFLHHSSGDVWFMSRDGIRRIDPEAKDVSAFLRGVRHDTFLFEDSKGTVFLGSYSYGLHALNPQENVFEEYKTNEGLVVSGALSLLEDRHGYLWISAKSDLVRFNPDNQNLTYFTEEDGLPPGGFTLNSAHAGRSGTFYFGSPMGLIALNPDEFAQRKQPPQVALTELRLSNEPVSLGEDSPLKQHISITQSISLKHDQNDISLSFAAFDFHRPEDNRFRYRLIGYDDDWQGPTADHRVNYTNLDPGNYTFRVLGANSDGVWNEEGATLRININPPWWQTTWAYIGYAFGLLGCMWVFDRFQRSRLIARERLRAEREKAQAIASTNDELERALKHLTETQDQLIHTAKMASLGQLTAGVAHELKNPLNFINNFAQLCADLVVDIEELLDKYRHSLSTEDAHELKSMLDDLKFNTKKINTHGRRADGIILSMLEHSRSGPGERRSVDLNQLLDEYANLSYHGVRARTKGYDVTVTHHFEDSLPEINIVPREIGRVFINLLDNAFYAVNEKRQLTNGHYFPRVTVTTRSNGEKIEIRIEDNGTGIPEDIQARIFEPFFTTKPTGSGTGLGLSLSYDIVTRGYGGSLTLESAEGEGAAFIILLPIAQQGASQQS